MFRHSECGKLTQIDTGGYIDNPTQKGWLTSILELGAWVGTLLSGFLAEVASRKYGILIASSVFILGVVIQACSMVGDEKEILAGRFITYNPATRVPCRLADQAQWNGCRFAIHDRPALQLRVRSS